MKEITMREKAAIALYLMDDKISPSDLFIVASDKSTQDVGRMKYLASSATHWFQQNRVQEYLRTQQLRQEDKRSQERSRIAAEMQSQGHNSPQPTGRIDYSDPKNRQRLYNDVIARSGDDPKTQLDAAKMFEQIQKDDREAAKAQRQASVYLPLTCSKCNLYLKAKEELKNI